MSDALRKTIMKNKGGYVLGLLFLLLGLLGLFGAVTMAYLDSVGYWSYPKDFLTALFRDRGSEQIGLGFQGLQLFHYSAGGAVFLTLGGVLLAIKRGVIHLVEEVTVVLKCKKCKGQWNETLSKASLETMNYPQVKSLSRRKCPNCSKFVRPRIVSIAQ